MKKQVFNPYLPLGEYIPDGEPHLFGDRVYIYGSHDKEGGETFCMLDYVTYSAPVEDLTDWRYEGVIYRADQDPQYGQEIENARLAGGNADEASLRPVFLHMYAPDVVQGNDGRCYLYYSMSGNFGVGGYIGPISVAVADSPVGPFEFLGFVRNPDGTPMLKYVLFDPAVLNDNGVIRLYYGTQYDFHERPDFTPDSEYVKQMEGMFGRSREEILGEPDGIMGAVTVTLQDDMLTIADEPRRIIPYRVKGTDFEEHPFFEGPSMRKMGEKYYFIYSSQQNHELCYAVSDAPDRDFVFGGTIVSNGDVGYQGRKPEDKLNMTGTTHGSIIEINGQWYVFYHRLTHKSDYSRQACAEKITIEPDGSIRQVEITSCGLNPAPLRGEGAYPAVICCNLTDGHMPHGSNSIFQETFPNVTHETYPAEAVPGMATHESEAREKNADGSMTERYIGEITDGTLIGYKYFDLGGVKGLWIRAGLEAAGEGRFTFRLSPEGPELGSIVIQEEKAEGTGTGWKREVLRSSLPDGIYPLYITYTGNVSAKLLEFGFLNE